MADILVAFFVFIIAAYVSGLGRDYLFIGSYYFLYFIVKDIVVFVIFINRIQGATMRHIDMRLQR
jgi:hypothetical protein